MRLAVFDIDGTVVRRSTERAFGRYLARHGLLGSRQVAAFVALGLKSLPTARAHTLKKNKGYLAGLRLDDIERLAQAFVATEIPPLLVPSVVARLERHVRQGDYVAVLSGTLDAIARALARRLGAHRGIGTLCVVENGVFRAATPLMHPFGAEKLAQAERLVAEFGLEPADVVAYADSVHDLELLRYAGTPVAVRPDRPLRRVAVDRGWEIIDDDPRATGRRQPDAAG
ncbi:MAG TPA: HAD-IB family hydrolase [Woeseiaceae bacterium]|nr:HAD-IB family hydrolase [Woeseiaceae bacterium]